MSVLPIDASMTPSVLTALTSTRAAVCPATQDSGEWYAAGGLRCAAAWHNFKDSDKCDGILYLFTVGFLKCENVL